MLRKSLSCVQKQRLSIISIWEVKPVSFTIPVFACHSNSGGADGAEEYLNNETLRPETYVDPDGKNSYDRDLSRITVKWDNAASPEEKLERIIIQKWIANWQLGNEAWADYRRTGYPHLIPATTAGNKSGGIVDSERGARRIPYPASEYGDNPVNINYAVTTYLGGRDDMGRDLWWAKKQSNT